MVRFIPRVRYRAVKGGCSKEEAACEPQSPSAAQTTSQSEQLEPDQTTSHVHVYWRLLYTTAPFLLTSFNHSW